MTRILILSEVRLYRETVAAALTRQGALEVVGTAGYRLEAIQRIRCARPDVVLADMAGAMNLRAIRAIGDTYPRVRIVGLGVREIERDLIACSKAGIHGYVPPDATIDELVAITDGVARGDSFCCAETIALARRMAATAPDDADGLTIREREVVRLLERGLSNKEIACELRIAVPTVKNHVHHILEKLAVARRSQAVAHLRRIAVPAGFSIEGASQAAATAR